MYPEAPCLMHRNAKGAANPPIARRTPRRRAERYFLSVADRSDDPGVLGNLPRSRPGTRSSKRASGSGAAKRQPAAGATSKRASTAARKSATAAKGSGARAAKPRKPAAASRPARERTTAPPPRRPAAQSADPVTQAVRLAGKVAETGVKTAVGILKRLPGGR